jgi:hypothetical protein
MSLQQMQSQMDNLDQAVQALKDRPDFEFLVDHFKKYREAYISDLTSTAVVENPQLLAHTSGCISVLDIILREIESAKSGSS